MDSRDLIHVLVVDEIAAERERVRRLLWPEADITVAGEAANAAEALQQLRIHQFEVAVLDLSLQRAQGLELVARLAKEYPSTAVIALCSEGAPGDAEAALRCGAVSCVCKARRGEQLTPAIRAAAAVSRGAGEPTGLPFRAVAAPVPEAKRERVHLK
jgi:DNA-binding NarL/FixJ family response regulator